MLGSGIRPLEQLSHLRRQGRQVGARDHDIAVRLYPSKDGKGFLQPVEVAGGVERATRRIRQDENLAAHFEFGVDPHLTSIAPHLLSCRRAVMGSAGGT
jgi:hypothetical protein